MNGTTFFQLKVRLATGQQRGLIVNKKSFVSYVHRKWLLRCHGWHGELHF